MIFAGDEPVRAEIIMEVKIVEDVSSIIV